MSKAMACWYCRNVCNTRNDGSGWTHDCKLGIDNTGFDDVSKLAEQCKSFDMRKGFQMGGYYTHMWFEYDGTLPEEGGAADGCMNWVIQGDLEFPIQDEDTQSEPMRIHICDFEQIEEWVAFWGKELRRRGWVSGKMTDKQAVERIWFEVNNLPPLFHGYDGMEGMKNEYGIDHSGDEKFVRVRDVLKIIERHLEKEAK